MAKETQRVPFKLLHMECCGHLLCWVNPRFPSYCPACGSGCYPQIKGWITSSDETAILKTELMGAFPMAEPVRYLSAEQAFRDDFDQQFTLQPGEVIYDAKTKMGPWAMMTELSFSVYGAGQLGQGYGQKYVRQPNGELHKVEG